MEGLGLDTLRPGAPAKARKRVGRGPGSGHGKTSGKGHKGQKARAGGTKGPGFEGGQMPIQMRVPKRGFTNARFRRRWQIVNISDLKDWPAGAAVTAAALAERRLVRSALEPIKLLAHGDPAVALNVEVHAASEAARAKIEAAGGTLRLTAGGALDPQGHE